MTRSPASEPLLTRLSLAQRLQHWTLLGSFALLALTGIPMRFPEVGWLGALYGIVGGLRVARVVHRTAAAVMVVDGLAHMVYLSVLLVRHRFDLKRAWPMLPSLKDVTDFWHTSLYYLGLSNGLPRYDRFSFREKFDYFAVFWGLPVMMVSGLILWFPVFFGNRLPDLAIGMAYIAHSDEAILAILAIVVWHMYNVHVSPGQFHRFRLWLDGKASRGEMIVGHPLEYERRTGEIIDDVERDRLTASVGLPGFRHGEGLRPEGGTGPGLPGGGG